MGAGCSSEQAAATGVKPAPQPGQADAKGGVGAPPPIAPPAAHVYDEFDEEELPTTARRDPVARLEALARCFDALDKDRSGTIDFKELKQYLFKTGVNISTIVDKAEELMAKMDLNSDNLISREEFVHMMEALLGEKSDEDLEVWVAEVVFTATSRNVVGFGDSLGEVMAGLQVTQEQVGQLKQCFQELDRNSSGFVELHEVKVLLGKSGLDMDAVSEEVTTIMAKLDKNGDNKISEQEFFITLSAVRKSLNSDDAFKAVLDNLLAIATSDLQEQPALAQVLLADSADSAAERAGPADEDDKY